MDGQPCDRHPSAWAKARIILHPSLNQLYLCGHCVKVFERTYAAGDYYIAYEAVSV